MNEVGVLVYTANDTYDSARITALLQSSGIPSYTKELGSGQLFKVYTGYSNLGTEIYVPADAADRARTLIEETEAQIEES